MFWHPWVGIPTDGTKIRLVLLTLSRCSSRRYFRQGPDRDGTPLGDDAMMQLADQEAARTYEELARLYDQQGQGKLRDWFLVLAADAAYNVGNENEAERLRSQLLAVNPHHLLKPFATFNEAIKSPDIQSYVADLRRTYPPETATQLLRTQVPSSPPQPTQPRTNQYLGEMNASDPALDMAFGGGMGYLQPSPEQTPTLQTQPQNPQPQQAPPQRKPKEMPTQPPAAPAQNKENPVPQPPKPQQTPKPNRQQTPPPKAAPKPQPQPQQKTPPQKQPPQPMPQRSAPTALPSAPVWNGNGNGQTNGAPKAAPAPAKTTEPTPTTTQIETPNNATEVVSYWMSTVLFGIVLAAGALLAVYTFAKPFLPDNFLGLR